MFYPAHIDGRTLVILTQTRRGFRSIVSGRLSYDGETLSLVCDDAIRSISDDELAAFQPVSANSRISECRGFDFFLLARSDE